MGPPTQLGYAYRRGARLTDEPPLQDPEIIAVRSRIAGNIQITDSPHSSLGSPCHLWQGCRRFRSEAYGAIKFRGRVFRVHRLMMTIKLGRWLASSEVVMHLCNQPACVNPDHLRVGSQSENIQQCYDEDRHPGPSELDELSVDRIHHLASQGVSSWNIAEELSLPRSTVQGYLKRHGQSIEEPEVIA